MSLELTRPHDISELIEYSAEVGANPLLIQGAGGNTSVKEGNVMWIKASGTLLADAKSKDIFVAVDLPEMRLALDNNEPRSDRPAEFTIGKGVLRPSIETSLHAVFKQRIVIHVHCVQTIAHAIQQNGKNLISQKLAGLNWCMVSYQKPGANLAQEVKAALKEDTDVVILANHGLLVAADSVIDAARLLSKVVTALTVKPDKRHKPNLTGLRDVCPQKYQVLPEEHIIHQLALGPDRVRLSTGGSLYPDHVIFCGVGAACMNIEDVSKIDLDTAPVFVIVPEKGVLVRQDASEGAFALIQCLAEVILRTPIDARLNYLTEEQNFELLDWDAEKYRQAMNAK
jgi:rhamnose utilization protein RhaD (predicted bifunctional aldolase and dehydrogenase)